MTQEFGPIVAPEAEKLRAFFEAAESRLLDNGLALEFRLNDSGEFCHVQRSFRVEPFKGYHPGVADTVMTGVVSRDGQPVGTVAGMPMVLDGHLSNHLATHGLFPGENQVLCDAAKDIGDTIASGICFTGGFAIHPDLRKSQISRILFEVLPVYVRARAWAHYQMASFFMVPAESVENIGPAKFALKYRAENLVPQVVWSGKDRVRWLGHASPEYTMRMVREALG